MGGELFLAWADLVVGSCRADHEVIFDRARRSRSEVIVIVASPVDLLPRRLELEGEFLTVRDPELMDLLRRSYRNLQSRMLERGLAVLWVDLPCIADHKGAQLGIDPSWVEPVNELLREIVDQAATPRLSVLDLNSLACPDGEFRNAFGLISGARTDGLHFSDAANDALMSVIDRAAAAVAANQ